MQTWDFFSREPFFLIRFNQRPLALKSKKKGSAAYVLVLRFLMVGRYSTWQPKDEEIKT